MGGKILQLKKEKKETPDGFLARLHRCCLSAVHQGDRPAQ